MERKYCDLNPREKLSLAKDEDTKSDLLILLSKDNDVNIRQAVAGNPNTSVEVLEELSKEFPEIVAANPVFDLLLLENPDSKFIKFVQARSSTTSTERLAKLVKDKNGHIGNNAIANPNTTLEILEKLIIVLYLIN